MKEKMNTDESRKIYSLGKITVEPVYGNMKQNLGFREFLLRGLEKAKIEMNLISIAHNLKKIRIVKWKIQNILCSLEIVLLLEYNCERASAVSCPRILGVVDF